MGCVAVLVSHMSDQSNGLAYVVYYISYYKASFAIYKSQVSQWSGETVKKTNNSRPDEPRSSKQWGSDISAVTLPSMVARPCLHQTGATTTSPVISFVSSSSVLLCFHQPTCRHLMVAAHIAYCIFSSSLSLFTHPSPYPNILLHVVE